MALATDGGWSDLLNLGSQRLRNPFGQDPTAPPTSTGGGDPAPPVVDFSGRTSLIPPAVRRMPPTQDEGTPPPPSSTSPPPTPPTAPNVQPFPGTQGTSWSSGLDPAKIRASNPTPQSFMDQYVQGFLNSGVKPQDLVDWVNKTYGLPNGESIAYDPTRGSRGVFEMPGGGYYSYDNNQWAFHPTSPETSGASTSANDIYTNAILSRIAQLGQPINDPLMNLIMLASVGRANDLMTQDPYTSSEDAALTARYMNPLATARDAARTQAMESAAQRGILPSSGVVTDSLNRIDTGYEQGVANAANQQAVLAVQQRQANRDKALTILGQAEQLAQSGRAEDRQRAIDMLTTAGLLPQQQSSQLAALLAASGNGSDATSLLNGLFGANNAALTQSGLTSAAWGQFIGALLSNPALLSSLFPNGS